MIVKPKELRDKGIEYCKKHSEGISCKGCPLDDHSMCITDQGKFSLQGETLDIIAFFRDFNKMIREIYREEAADE